jgi:hypothetical protein
MSGSGSTAEADPPVFLPLILTAPAGPTLAGCPLLPADNIWNTPVDNLPVDPNSNAYIAAIGSGRQVHADFGAGTEVFPIGIPSNIVSATTNQPSFSITLESDPGSPYPRPAAGRGRPERQRRPPYPDC